VSELRDAWRLEEAWWREKPLSRMYYQVLLEDGQRLTLFRDLATERWYQQHHA
jgi:hypothetical protein